MALLVSASPNPLPLDVSDADIAALDAGPAAGRVAGMYGLQRSPSQTFGAAGGNVHAMAGAGSAQSVGGPIAASTRNIGSQVTSALSQIPLLGASH
jgi:hypothetical protein